MRLKSKGGEMKEALSTAESTSELLVKRAKQGDRQALEALIRSIQDRIYGLALRMLYYPADAEDATQEILVKIITHLDAFRRESSFITWAYRIASNHLLTTRKRRAEQWDLTFEKCEKRIERGLSYCGRKSYNHAENGLILEEMKLVCMQALLLCLSRELRIAFILGVVFQATGIEGGEILDISPESFRQRLSRGRKQISNFMATKCSLVNPKNSCHCERILPFDIEKECVIDPENLLFADHACHAKKNAQVMKRLEELDELVRVTVLFRSHPDYAAPEAFVDIVKNLMDSGRFQLLEK
jgi:RNA polymerase sigma factor (sigma-70 family)